MILMKIPRKLNFKQFKNAIKSKYQTILKTVCKASQRIVIRHLQGSLKFR